MTDRKGVEAPASTPEYSKLTAGELDEIISDNLLGLVLYLVERDVERAVFKDELADINGAVAELVSRSDQGWPKDLHAQYLQVLDERDLLQSQLDYIGGALQAARLDMQAMVNRLNVDLADRGEEENDTQ